MQPTNKQLGQYLILGLFIFFFGVWIGTINFYLGLIIGVPGALLALIMADKLRNRFNKWMDE
jgi:hypothetical protein